MELCGPHIAVSPVMIRSSNPSALEKARAIKNARSPERSPERNGGYNPQSPSMSVRNNNDRYLNTE